MEIFIYHIFVSFSFRSALVNISKIENRIQIFKLDVPIEKYNFDLGWTETNQHVKRKKLKSGKVPYKSSQTFGMSKVNYKTCAIVGNSGILLNSHCGKEIDKYEFIIRANMAPIEKFVEDVGRKTNIMTINFQVINYMLGNFTSDSDDSNFWREEYKSRLNYLNSSILWYFKNTANLDLVQQLASIIRNDLKLPLHIAFSPKGLGSPTRR